jgi:cobalt transporter subunit CbtB
MPSGGGRKDKNMASTSTANVTTSTQSRTLPLALAALLGMFIVGFVGFSHAEAVHNAGHDYRHSMAFPCH